MSNRMVWRINIGSIFDVCFLCYYKCKWIVKFLEKDVSEEYYKGRKIVV